MQALKCSSIFSRTRLKVLIALWVGLSFVWILPKYALERDPAVHNGGLQFQVQGGTEKCNKYNLIHNGLCVTTKELKAARKPLLVQKDNGRNFNRECFRQVHVWSNEHLITRWDSTCPGVSCGVRVVADTNYATMQTSDALILLHRTYWDWNKMYLYRPPDQKWIFFSQESLFNTKPWAIPPPVYANEYDYIMSYDLKRAHFYGAYGKFDTSRPTVADNDTRNWAAGKTKSVAWLASNCGGSGVHWRRYEFVDLLSRYIGVDRYGGCGSRCGNGPKSCHDELREHKFYLSLENSACSGYITEKLWDNAYHSDAIPIVFGPPRADYEAVAPPNSFIHVEDFESMKELAGYLIMLHYNVHLYNKYFEWKKLGRVVLTNEDVLMTPRGLCQVVKRLLDDEKAKAEGTYKKPPLPNWNTLIHDSCVELDFPIEV